jgi:zinc transport system ATP-binding protein
MNKPIVSFEKVSYEADRRSILQGIDFDLKQGEFVSLIGPNGAGKTTFLKLLIGRLQPTSGEVHRNSGLKIGYMPQRITVDSTLPMTTSRFMSLFSNDKKDIEATLDAVNASSLLNTNIAHLSGGELQRVLLARCLLNPSELLILDEPVQWVDFLGQKRLYDLILHYHQKKGRTVLIVSHDLNNVLKESDRVICLNNHICCEGPPDHVQSSPSYKKLFPEEDKLTTYTHNHDHTHDHT